MSRLQPVQQVTAASFADQASLRRTLLSGLLASLRGSTTPEGAIEALRAHGPALVELGLNDEAARLNALARAVSADLRRFTAEAEQLERAAAAK